MRKLDRHVELQSFRRICFVNRFAVDDSDRLRETENFRLPIDTCKSGTRQRLVELRSASIQNRRLGTVHFDCEIVDPQCCDRRENVLDGMDRVDAIAKLRPSLSLRDLIDTRRYWLGTADIDAA